MTTPKQAQRTPGPWLNLPRRCPRCRSFLHQRTDVQSHQAICSNCAHEWRVTRLTKDERSDFIEAQAESVRRAALARCSDADSVKVDQS